MEKRLNLDNIQNIGNKVPPIKNGAGPIIFSILYFFILNIVWNITKIFSYFTYDLDKGLKLLLSDYFDIFEGFVPQYLFPLLIVFVIHQSIKRSLSFYVSILILWVMLLYLFSNSSEDFGYIIFALPNLIYVFFLGLLIGFTMRYVFRLPPMVKTLILILPFLFFTISIGINYSKSQNFSHGDCESIDTSDHSSGVTKQNSCYDQLARKTKDVSYCFKISGSNIFQLCFDSIMTLSPNTDYNICIERLTDSDEQAGCLWVFALLKKDASICSHITDEQLNHNCSVDVKEKEERRLWEINSGLY